MPKPKAVLLSDVHFSLNTIEPATIAMETAFAKANELNVPLCVLGDLNDSKAIIRGECLNAMIKVFDRPHKKQPRVLIGNHDLINERSKEHTLGFLRPYAKVIDEVWHDEETAATFIPYQSEPSVFVALCQRSPGYLLLCHQGYNSGTGFVDHSAVTPAELPESRYISGHYHARQTYRPSNWHNGSYQFLGNPYTLGFAEANDPEKGFHVLYDDNQLAFHYLDGVPRHRALRAITSSNAIIGLDDSCSAIRDIDRLLVKLSGPQAQLNKVTKAQVKQALNLPTDSFRLDLISTDEVQEVEAPKLITSEELLDNVINSMQNTTTAQQYRLKALWRKLAAQK